MSLNKMPLRIAVENERHWKDTFNVGFMSAPNTLDTNKVVFEVVYSATEMGRRGRTGDVHTKSPFAMGYYPLMGHTIAQMLQTRRQKAMFIHFCMSEIRKKYMHNLYSDVHEGIAKDYFASFFALYDEVLNAVEGIIASGTPLSVDEGNSLHHRMRMQIPSSAAANYILCVINAVSENMSPTWIESLSKQTLGIMCGSWERATEEFIVREVGSTEEQGSVTHTYAMYYPSRLIAQITAFNDIANIDNHFEKIVLQTDPSID